MKIAVRNLYRNKVYSFINIFGLGLGLATGFIMLLWVNTEYGTNRFHSKSDRIHQVNAQVKFSDGTETWEYVPAPVATFARQHATGVEKAARIKNYGIKQPVKAAGQVFIETKVAYTENDFFEVFDFPIVKGNPAEPFAEGLSVVLSETTAKKYFGDANPIGQTIFYRDTTIQVSTLR